MTGGSVLTIGGMLGQAATATKDFLSILIVQEAPEKINLTGNYVAYAGLATMATSIPFFISSGKNKKRANISLTQEKITMGHKINQQTNYNSIALSISLGK
jgi:galactokinase